VQKTGDTEMSRFKKLSHTIYYCVYHIVFCPKYRYSILKGDIAEYCRQQIYRLCSQKDLVEVLELNIQLDHIHIILSIAPKYSVSSTMGYLKGKLSLNLFHRYERLGKRYWGRHFWSRGYCVSTVGLNEDQIRKYVKWQTKKDKELERHQLDLL